MKTNQIRRVLDVHCYSGQAVEEKSAQALEAGAAKHMQEADFEAQCLGYLKPLRGPEVC